MKQERAARDRRPIIALLGANAVSQVGNSMTIMAGAWFVLEGKVRRRDRLGGLIHECHREAT